MEEVKEIISMPRIGDQAPAFEAMTTMGPIKFPDDFKGQWVVFFSHPADFTPVCSTEFLAFAQMNNEFAKRNVQLLGLSIDSVFSHIAWVMNLKEKTGIEIPFPIVADVDGRVAKLYGMLHPGESSTATVRAVFIVDPNGKIRAIIYYPLSAGRNMREILRLIDALQTADKHGVATPANWVPEPQVWEFTEENTKVIVPPPTTYEEAVNRFQQGYECIDWYFCKKKLS
ncbi:peroxiredoxin [Thermodesulfobacterium geofontis OPF15]|jgi:peroxiredoxin (alkyl hydroperoxide reductase subunit C)|uniref:Peroxiredoxin n=1 Tax=Thermodesulfobacterium geofontis (strain OPF15) TaxID=795359 RepID=F8C4J2_THEGP|nr:peroxiredoxin [Thermodesulfobacterium geofontis]AEH22658.1 peroxiredoxin [Thermodesulfobacterium geofontis OPF15]